MNTRRYVPAWLSVLLVMMLVVSGCSQQSESQNAEAIATDEVNKDSELSSKVTPESEQSRMSITEVVSSQPEAVKARYSARHPQETLTFFEIEQGQTVVEALPGGGWYTKLILPVLGANGKVIGADYAADMYPKFGFFSAEMIESKKTWVDSWTTEANTWRTSNSAEIQAFQFGSMPAKMNGSADRVLFIRALHNLARFENDGGYLTKALTDAFNVLKPGGIVGIVQHMAPEESSDEWANGSNGYLKVSFIKAKMKELGFEFVAASDININQNDQPTEKDFVWRLPPTYVNSKDNPELKKQYEAIGESTRMTLKFRKP